MSLSFFSFRTSWFFLFLSIAAAHFFVDTMLGIWPMYKFMAKLDPAIGGVIVGLGALIGEGSQLFFGPFSDKGYTKHLLIFGLLIGSANLFLIYTAHYEALFLLYLMTCIGSGSFHPSAASVVSHLFPSYRNLSMAVFAACGSLGLATSQLTFNAFLELFHGRLYLLFLPIFILGGVLALTPFPQKEKEEKQEEGSLHFIRDFVSFFKHPTLRFLYLSQVANQSILWGTIFILPDVLQAGERPDWICYGGGHFCFIFGAACLMIPGGYLADLYSPRSVMVGGGIIAACTFYFILWMPGLSSAALLAALFTLGATLALMNPLAVSFGNKLEPKKAGAVSAFLMGMVWCVSEAIGPGGVGLLTKLFADLAPVKALSLLGILFVLQIGASILLPKEAPSESVVNS